MTKDERRDRSRELQALLNKAPFKKISASQLGRANFAWLHKVPAAPPYSTADAASQSYALLRKGQTLGDSSLDRINPFIEMLGNLGERNQDDVVPTIERLAAQNGKPIDDQNPADHPIGAVTKELPPELAISAEVTEALAGAFGQVKLLYEQKKGELVRREDELAGLRSEVRQLEGILKAAGIVPREKRSGHPGRRPTQEEPAKKRPGHGNVSDATALVILDQIREFFSNGGEPALPDVAGSFTRPQIEQATGRHHSQVSAAIEKLREQGHIRAAGITKHPTSGMKTNVYALEAV